MVMERQEDIRSTGSVPKRIAETAMSMVDGSLCDSLVLKRGRLFLCYITFI